MLLFTNRHKHETPSVHAYFYLHNRVIPLAHASASPRTYEYFSSHTWVLPLAHACALVASVTLHYICTVIESTQHDILWCNAMIDNRFTLIKQSVISCPAVTSKPCNMDSMAVLFVASILYVTGQAKGTKWAHKIWPYFPNLLTGNLWPF